MKSDAPRVASAGCANTSLSHIFAHSVLIYQTVMTMAKKSSPLGVSINFLKEFKQQHLVQAGHELSWNKLQCVENAIKPRASEGRCSLAVLEERYNDAKGNVHSGDANALWLYSDDAPMTEVIEQVKILSHKLSNKTSYFHFIDAFCDNHFSEVAK